LNSKISQILYFGEPDLQRGKRKGSLKPPRDYDQKKMNDLLSNYNINCQRKYVKISDEKNESLIEKYDVTDSHTWVLEFYGGQYEIYSEDQQFFKRISELS